jgi:ABC-type branched-subunit amino acid transport system substrate-binding protein
MRLHDLVMSSRQRICAVSVRLALAGLAGCSALVDTSTKACSSHAQCQRKFDESAYCRHDGVCAKLFSDECTELYWFGETGPVRAGDGQLPDTNAIIIGFMGPAKKDPNDEAYAKPLRNAAHEAVRSIERVYPNGAAQTLALLDCNDATDPALVFRHLAEDVRAPAVIGPVFSSTTLKVLDSLERDGDTMLLSPSATAINFTNEVSPRLWRTVPPDTYQIDALIALYKKLLADGQVHQPPTVVACMQPGWCDSFRGTLVGELSRANINAPPALVYERNKAGELEKIAAQLKQDKPELIIGVGIGELGDDLLPLLETGSDAIAPIYLFPEAERGTTLEETIRMHASRNIQSRVLGTAPGPRVPDPECGADQGAFLNQVESGNLGEFAYDAAFLLAYGLSLGGDAHPTGLALAHSLTRLSCKDKGKTLLVANPQRYGGIAKGIAQKVDVCADYCGVSGPLDFPEGPLDQGTRREAASDIGFWCPVIDASGKFSYAVPPGAFEAAKPYYDSTSEQPTVKERDQLRLCTAVPDAGTLPDAGAASDAGQSDGGMEGGVSDAGALDAGALDAGAKDAGPSSDASDAAKAGG